MNVGVVRGFDLYFCRASATALADIAKKLGGNTNYSPEEGRVTHFFEEHHPVDLRLMNELHNLLDHYGQASAEEFDCEFDYAECYLLTNEQILSNLGRRSG